MENLYKWQLTDQYHESYYEYDINIYNNSEACRSTHWMQLQKRRNIVHIGPILKSMKKTFKFGTTWKNTVQKWTKATMENAALISVKHKWKWYTAGPMENMESDSLKDGLENREMVHQMGEKEYGVWLSKRWFRKQGNSSSNGWNVYLFHSTKLFSRAKCDNYRMISLIFHASNIK